MLDNTAICALSGELDGNVRDYFLSGGCDLISEQWRWRLANSATFGVSRAKLNG